MSQRSWCRQSAASFSSSPRRRLVHCSFDRLVRAVVDLRRWLFDCGALPSRRTAELDLRRIPYARWNPVPRLLRLEVHPRDRACARSQARRRDQISELRHWRGLAGRSRGLVAALCRLLPLRASLLQRSDQALFLSPEADRGPAADLPLRLFREPARSARHRRRSCHLSHDIGGKSAGRTEDHAPRSRRHVPRSGDLRAPRRCCLSSGPNMRSPSSVSSFTAPISCLRRGPATGSFYPVSPLQRSSPPGSTPTTDSPWAAGGRFSPSPSISR